MISEKIVVIDDDPKVVRSVELALNEHEIIAFHKGQEALDFLSQPNEINLILLDVMMPQMDGITVLQSLEKFKKQYSVIMMTAYASTDIAIQALRHNATDFIEKPFNIPELKEKVRTLLKKNYQENGHSQVNRVERIKRYIQRNHSNVSLDSIANELCLSTKYVSRMFNEQNNSSFRDYKIKIKMDMAKSLLANSTFTVNEIAEKLGYLNPESFMRIFKRKTHLTPSQYREQINPSV